MSHFPKVMGVSRLPESAQMLFVSFQRPPTDDELRAFDDYLNRTPITSPPEEGRALSRAEVDQLRRQSMSESRDDHLTLAEGVYHFTGLVEAALRDRVVDGFVTIHVDEYDKLGCCQRLLETIATGQVADPVKAAELELLAHNLDEFKPRADRQAQFAAINELTEMVSQALLRAWNLSTDCAYNVTKGNSDAAMAASVDFGKLVHDTRQALLYGAASKGEQV